MKSKIPNWDTLFEDYDKVLDNETSGYCNFLNNNKWTSVKRT